MSEAPSSLAAEAGYIPNAPLPDYRYMISVVKRVRGFFPDEFEHGATPCNSSLLAYSTGPFNQPQ